MTPTEPNRLSQVSREAYDAIRALNYSKFSSMRKSAAHCRQELISPRETEALSIGQALHSAILTPDLFEAQYVRGLNLQRRSNKDKAAWAEFELANVGRVVLKDDEFNEIDAIRRAVMSSPMAAGMLSSPGAKAEICAQWMDEEVGTPCKALIDLLCRFAGSKVVDLKFVRDASPSGFARAISTYGYHVQAAWYTRGLNAIAPYEREFVFVAVEKDPPYAVACYTLEPEAMAEGSKLALKWARQFLECERSGVWPGYSDSSITLPRWAFTESD